MIKSIFKKELSSLTYLNITQFLGALNDNIYRSIIVFFLLSIYGESSKYFVMSTTGIVFVLPFLLFSATSGKLADNYSKRNIIVLTKVLELLIMTFGLLTLTFESAWGSFATLFLMATQSALFSPSKYGIIPEIVEEDKISKANGILSSFTFLAIIAGTFLAAFICDISNKNFILAAILCCLVSLLGLIASFGIAYTEPVISAQERKLLKQARGESLLKDFSASPILNLLINFLAFAFTFVVAVWRAIKVAYLAPSLLAAILGSAYFLFLGAFMQFNILPFGMESLGLTDVQSGYLFIFTAVGIGTGSILSGKISGKKVELGLVPIAALLIGGGLFILDYVSNQIVLVIPMIIILGILGGLFQLPLDAYIQVASPHDQRGKIVAATNFLSYSGVLLASGFIALNSYVLGLDAASGFSMMGIFTLIVGGIFCYRYFDYMTRFIGFILSRLHFKIEFRNREVLVDEPTLFICTHEAWNDTLLLLGSQRRRMRFFIEQERAHKKWMKRLYKALRVIMIPPIEPLEMNGYCLGKMQKAFKNGFSVCIFIENNDAEGEVRRIRDSSALCEAIGNVPIVIVRLEKGEKNKKSSLSWMSRVLNKIHVPVKVSFESVL